MSIATILLIVGLLGVFFAVFITFAAVGVFDNDARGVSKSLAVVEAFTAAPKGLQDELNPPFKDRVLTPLVNRFVGLGKKVTPEDYGDRIRHRLEVAGNPPWITVDRVIALKVIGFALFLLLAVVYVTMAAHSMALNLAIGVGAAMVGYFAPNIYLYNKGTKRTASMQKAFPDTVDLLTISVEAGLGFDAALAQVARNTEGPLAEEFSRVLQEMQIGLGRSEALRAVGSRTTLPEMRGFVGAMVQADAFGIPIGQVLRVQSSEVRVKRRQRAEEKAQKLPVKVLFPLLFFIMPCLFIAILGPAIIKIVAVFSGQPGL